VTQPGVVFDSVWKKFRRGERHDSLRDLVPAAARRLLRRSRGNELREHEFWVLSDVSFEVKAGTAMGIIGSNGAGKSTSLKLLTRILKPTKGCCQFRGRVGALIEVAAGFHGDLTGRENVFLQGAIMGMRQKEIRAKFDEIVAFSGIESFIDTPVKRYSSGMNARLGFSIAAHLNPDVLVIDEVLAVGDLQFQKRAFEKIESVVRNGAAAVVVSHQLDRVVQLCASALLLEKGRVVERGRPVDCIQAYLQRSAPAPAGSHDAADIQLDDLSLDHADQVQPGGRVLVRITGHTFPDWNPRRHVLGLRVVSTETGTRVFTTGSDRLPMNLPLGETFSVTVQLTLNLNGGNYMLQSFVWDAWEHREAVAGPSRIVVVDPVETMSGQSFLDPIVVEPTVFTHRDARRDEAPWPAAM
jgi:ABC-type polysaccharide/polyol phosphate transport system ATPase subunit